MQLLMCAYLLYIIIINYNQDK